MAAQKKKRVKKTSFDAFLNWLEGVKDMQEDDWIPDAKQWERIQEKIDAVDVRLDFAEESTPPPSGPVMRAPASSTIPPFPQAPGSVPADAEIINSTVLPRAPKQPTTSKAPIAVDPKIPVKTPDIDDDGPYVSSFT